MLRSTSLLAFALAIALSGCGGTDKPDGSGGSGGAAGAGGSGGTGGTGGSGGTGGQQENIERVEVDVDPDLICAGDCLHLDEGATVQLVAMAFGAGDEPVDDVTFTWSSSDEAVATVDENGLVTGISSGAAQISAAAGGKQGTIGVQVGAQQVMSIRAFPENTDGEPVVVTGKWAPVSVTAFADGWGMAPVFDATFEWTASSESVEVREGARSEDGSVRFELRAAEAGAFTVSFTSPGSAEEVEGVVTLQVIEPTVAPGAFPFASIAVGGEVACGLGAGGELSCWGSNFNGQLALGEETLPEPHPVARPGALPFARLSLGQTSSCAVDADGIASCWGENFWGQAGLGDDDEPVFMCTLPSPVAGGHAFTSISAGFGHSCGVDDAGAAWCWGNNQDGQLGLGAGAPDHTRAPAAVEGGHVFTRIRAGNAVSCALDGDGKAWCWGAPYAPLGSDRGGDFSPATEPIPVAGDHTFVALEVSFSHACGIDDEGSAWCWGDNTSGQLGIGRDEPIVAEPALVSGGHAFAGLALGASHTCAVDLAGAAWCWGGNQSGSLGDGGLAASAAPVQVIGDLSFESIAAGGSTTCGVTADGFGYCWGSSGAGQLGSGLMGTMRPLPTAITKGTCEWCVQ